MANVLDAPPELTDIPEGPLDVLVIAPHPDDAELGMGGAILKMLSRGLSVGVLDYDQWRTDSARQFRNSQARNRCG